MVEENMHTLDTLAKNMDRIALHVDPLKTKAMPPKHNLNETTKSIQRSMNESRERTTKLKAKEVIPRKSSPTRFLPKP